MRRDDRDRFLVRSLKALQTSAVRAGSAAAASYSLIGAILLLGAMGYWCDRWLGSSPWGLVGGLLLGVLTGFYLLIKTVWLERR